VVEELEVKGNAKIGSPDRRSGVTLYDEQTGTPYCLTVSGGVTKTTSGECGLPAQPPTQNTQSQSSPTPAPESQPTPPPETTSTPTEELTPASTPESVPEPAPEPTPALEPEVTPTSEPVPEPTPASADITSSPPQTTTPPMLN